MKWYIHHTQLPTTHVDETVRFYRDTLGLEGWMSGEEYSGRRVKADTDSCAFVSHTGQALHIGKPDLMFALANQMPFNPTYGHIAINVPDLHEMRARLRAANVVFADPSWSALPNMRHLYVRDPAMNLIEINSITEE